MLVSICAVYGPVTDGIRTMSGLGGILTGLAVCGTVRSVPPYRQGVNVETAVEVQGSASLLDGGTVAGDDGIPVIRNIVAEWRPAR